MPQSVDRMKLFALIVGNGDIVSKQDDTVGRDPRGKRTQSRRKGEKPGWADGLRTMYNSVLDEPLPDSFSDLLRKLDQVGDG